MADSCKPDVPVPERLKDDPRLWRDVPRDDSAPFIHRFQTRRRKYIFDVNTLRIIRVSSVVWDIIEDYGRMSSREITAKYAKIHGKKNIAAAISGITSARREKGLFLSSRPRKVLPPSKDMVKKHLDEKREQLILNVTEDCNFRCSYCIFGGSYKHQRTHSSKAMSWPVARAAIDEYLAHSRHAEARTISFYGGEPLLNLALIRKCVSYVRKKRGGRKVQFAMTCNGYLLRGRAAEFLGREKFSMVISLDGPAKVHDRCRRTRGGRPTWDRVLGNVRGFLAAFPAYRRNGRLRFNAVATRATDLRDVQSFFGSCEAFTDSMGVELNVQKELPGDTAEYNPDSTLAISGGSLFADFVAELKKGLAKSGHTSKARWARASFFQKPYILFHKRKIAGRPLPARMRLLSTCIPGARRTFVSAAGEYFACERVPACRSQQIGDIKGGLDCDKVMALLGRWNAVNAAQCRYCWCVSTCKVGCFATVGDDGRVTAKAKSKACAICRRNTDQLLAQYCDILEENPRAFDFSAEISLM